MTLLFERPEIFWFLCIAVVLANAAVFRYRLSRYAASDSRMLEDGRKIIRAWALFGTGLFVILAIGTSLGLTGRLVPFQEDARITKFDFFGLLIALAMFGRATFWVYREEGAERLAEHHKMFNNFPKTARGVKIFWIFLLIAVVFSWFFTLFRGWAPSS